MPYQCLDGVYCTPQMSDFLSYANQFEIKGDNNVKQIYRIEFMCRAAPMKIRQSQNYSNYYISSGELDEIRPYRLLIKENSIGMVENWTGEKIVSMIFDSDVDNWDSGKDFSIIL